MTSLDKSFLKVVLPPSIDTLLTFKKWSQWLDKHLPTLYENCRLITDCSGDDHNRMLWYYHHNQKTFVVLEVFEGSCEACFNQTFRSSLEQNLEKVYITSSYEEVVAYGKQRRIDYWPWGIA